MKFSQTINVKRLLNLILNDTKFIFKPVLITAVSIFLLLTFSPINIPNLGLYLLVLYLGGFYVTCSIFQNMHVKEKAYFYLTLPCTNLERLLSKWFLSSIGFALGLLIVYFMASFFTAVLTLFVFKQPLNVLNPYLWKGIGYYVILQSILFYGSVCFRKFAFIKTIFALCCLLAGLFILCFLLVHNLDLIFPHNLQTIKLSSQDEMRKIILYFITTCSYAFKIAMPSLFIYLTYRKIKNYEIN
jgi:hypothetical protein